MEEITTKQAVAALEHGLVKHITVAGKTYGLKEDGIEGYPKEDFMYRGMQWTVTDSEDQEWMVHMFLYEDGHYEAAIQRKGSEAPAKIFASGAEVPSWEHLKTMAFAAFGMFEEYEKGWAYAFSDYQPDEGPEITGGHVIDTMRLNDEGEFLCVVEYDLADGENYHEIMYVGLENDCSAFTTDICLIDTAGKDTVDVLRTYPMKDWTKMEEGMKLDAIANSVDVWLSHSIKDEMPGYGEKSEGKPYPTEPRVFDEPDSDEAETEVKSDVSFLADGKPVTVKQVANGYVDRLEAGKCKYMVVPVVGPKGNPLCKQEILFCAQTVLLRQFKGEYFNPDKPDSEGGEF